MLRYLLVLLIFAMPLWAAEIKLAPSNTEVNFTYEIGSDPAKGRFPAFSGVLNFDPNRPSAATVDVTLDAAKATAGFIFATEALRAPTILDVKNHPNIRFRSTSVQVASDGRTATVTGRVTIRSVERPLSLTARLLRVAGTDTQILEIEGSLNRHDFGASGFRKEVGAILGIRIRTTLPQ